MERPNRLSVALDELGAGGRSGAVLGLVVMLGPSTALLIHSGQAELIGLEKTIAGWLRLVVVGRWADRAGAFASPGQTATPGPAGFWASLLCDRAVATLIPFSLLTRCESLSARAQSLFTRATPAAAGAAPYGEALTSTSLAGTAVGGALLAGGSAKVASVLCVSAVSCSLLLGTQQILTDPGADEKPAAASKAPRKTERPKSILRRSSLPRDAGPATGGGIGASALSGVVATPATPAAVGALSTARVVSRAPRAQPPAERRAPAQEEFAPEVASTATAANTPTPVATPGSPSPPSRSSAEFTP